MCRLRWLTFFGPPCTMLRYIELRCVVKPKFHYTDFPVTSATSPRQTRDVPFSPNFITPTSPKLPRAATVRGSFGEVGAMEFDDNRTGDVTSLSRTSRGSRYSGIWAWINTSTLLNSNQQSIQYSERRKGTKFLIYTTFIQRVNGRQGLVTLISVQLQQNTKTVYSTSVDEQCLEQIYQQTSPQSGNLFYTLKTLLLRVFRFSSKLVHFSAQSPFG